jgi:adenylate kinase family enzyme
MKRVVIIGSGGAGKSTLAVRLGEIVKIEVLHLDQLYWKPNWVESPKDEWIQTVAGLLQKETWIMDGNFGGTMEMRMAACDTVIWLDLPPTVCVYQALKRTLKYYGKTRPDMTEGCRERFDWDFLWWIWTFERSKSGKTLTAAIEKFKSEKNIIRLKSNREIEKFLLKFQ